MSIEIVKFLFKSAFSLRKSLKDGQKMVSKDYLYKNCPQIKITQMDLLLWVPIFACSI